MKLWDTNVQRLPASIVTTIKRMNRIFVCKYRLLTIILEKNLFIKGIFKLFRENAYAKSMYGFQFFVTNVNIFQAYFPQSFRNTQVLKNNP